MRSINKTQVLVGCVALFVGLLIYLVDRPPDHIYFSSVIRIHTSECYWNPGFFSVVGGYLPSFLHVFAFALLIAGLLTCRKTGYLIICCAWLLIDFVFEVGQKQSIWDSQLITKWFEQVFILENMQSYFLMGTFDFFDLVVAFAGAAAAYCVLIFTMEERRR